MIPLAGHLHPTTHRDYPLDHYNYFGLKDRSSYAFGMQFAICCVESGRLQLQRQLI